MFPRGNLATPTLVSELTAAGHEVDDVIVYETVTNRSLVSALQTLQVLPDYIVLFSPSGAAASLTILIESQQDKLKHTKIIAIGPTTQAEIERKGLKVYKVLSKPTV